MRKILILFLIATSLGFSANYKVEVKPNVKIQKMELEQNNLEIEKRFTEMTNSISRGYCIGVSSNFSRFLVRNQTVISKRNF